MVKSIISTDVNTLRSILLISISLMVLSLGCKQSTETADEQASEVEEIVETPYPVGEKKNVRVPAISADSADAFILQQLTFGPRVPNSPGHIKTRDWIIAKLESYDVNVVTQDFNVEDYTGKVLNATNIIGQINPEHTHRVVLAAHWDTRFMADEDPDNIEKPIMGADDGASGVAGLLEIARTIHENPIDMGVDLVFFDVEDQGEAGGLLESWCMGSQYWAMNPHTPNYSARFGILLDMIGAKGAIFQTENLNGVFDAAKVQRITNLYNKVWAVAKAMKRDNMFMNRKINAVTDDHYFVNLHTDIPMIDIIHRPLESETGFGPHWHTQEDSYPIIDKRTLNGVIQVVAAVLYRESGYSFLD